ncbi:quinone oxidoreductase family protein [Ehrlichia canis]|uniref:Zinc-containing alcohol dehydrogenase superfamily n=1 Tax=Ehrlichia canis (strain Jake) TaxID=269484 RepID=A0ACA6AXC7_EHRCJ|nr:quinone oxidoreductase [Ehrlichia canis]AAZ68664.1 Zinc-containing alcohol dehydrogenase superfamily [Ehrlichia canis str. Jake]AUO54605.1 quinone oxidoreductase [Ehrlichia canis]UKC53304.1 quinone oxidoreductase [Ehrlichia canis]UKC54241.1 quinone oxidoreductase [Ehrlichia canis]UKC55177.1 quinone oxidoreductase [Ehrlichia canis]
MVKIIVIDKTGGTEVFKYVDHNIGEPKDDEVLIQHTVIGLNRYDLECRNGMRKTRKLPTVLGIEAVGVVERLGKDVEVFNVGDRVGYCTVSGGAYSEKRIVNQKYLVRIPDDVTDQVAAAVLFKGMTAHYLTHIVYAIRPKTFALVHGATGGVGQILCQWASYKGCKVIGVISSDDRANIALRSGCSYIVNCNSKNFVEQVMEITQGTGVNVVYDSVGALTSKESFASLGMFGIYVSYGQISGAVSNVSASMLSSRSLFFTAPSVFHYKRSSFDLAMTSMELFEVIRRNHIKVSINKIYKFDDIVTAHQDLENRKLTGSNIIVL